MSAKALQARIKKLRAIRRTVINVGVVVICLLAAGITARFIYIESGVVREYNIVRDELKANISSLSSLNAVADELLNDQPANVKDFDEYHSLSNSVKSSNDLIGKFDNLVAQSSGIINSSIYNLKHFDDQILNYSTKIKAQTDALQKVVDTLSVDDLTNSLKTAITDASIAISEGSKLLGIGATSELSTEVENANSLIGADVSDETKAKLSSAIRDQLKDELSKLTNKTADLKDKIARKKGISTNPNNTTKKEN